MDRRPGSVRLRPAAEQTSQPCKPLDHAAGHEDDDQHEDHAEREVPAVADEEADHGDHGIGQPLRQEVEHAVQRRLVKAEKIFSKYLMMAAPRTGPSSVPAPPRIVISTTSPEAVHCMRTAPDRGRVTASREAARPANQPGSPTPNRPTGRV